MTILITLGVLYALWIAFTIYGSVRYCRDVRAQWDEIARWQIEEGRQRVLKQIADYEKTVAHKK